MKIKALTKYVSLIVFIISLATIGFPKEKLVESKWTAQPPVIDGVGEEWIEDVLTTEKSVKVDYAVRNDTENVYVLFVFKEPKYMSSVNFTGITLYFNTEGKKNKDLGYHFQRKQVSPDELIAYMDKHGEPLTDEQRQELKTKPAYVIYMADVIGKDSEEDATGVTRSPDVLRPAFKISQKGKEVVYEFRIPLDKSEVSPEGIGTGPGQNIKVGFEWGGITEQMRQAMNARARDQAGRDISTEGGAGGVIVSGQDRGMPTSSRAIPKKHSFWADVKLAQNQ